MKKKEKIYSAFPELTRDSTFGARRQEGNRKEKELGTHSSTLAWKIPWMEKPGGLQFMGSQKSKIQLSN